MVTQNRLNGVDVDKLVGTINAIQQNPNLAHFQFRAHTDWVSGGNCKTRIQGFYGAGQGDGE